MTVIPATKTSGKREKLINTCQHQSSEGRECGGFLKIKFAGVCVKCGGITILDTEQLKNVRLPKDVVEQLQKVLSVAINKVKNTIDVFYDNSLLEFHSFDGLIQYLEEIVRPGFEE